MGQEALKYFSFSVSNSSFLVTESLVTNEQKVLQLILHVELQLKLTFECSIHTLHALMILLLNDTKCVNNRIINK